MCINNKLNTKIYLQTKMSRITFFGSPRNNHNYGPEKLGFKRPAEKIEKETGQDLTKKSLRGHSLTPRMDPHSFHARFQGTSDSLGLNNTATSMSGSIKKPFDKFKQSVPQPNRELFSQSRKHWNKPDGNVNENGQKHKEPPARVQLGVHKYYNSSQLQNILNSNDKSFESSYSKLHERKKNYKELSPKGKGAKFYYDSSQIQTLLSFDDPCSTSRSNVKNENLKKDINSSSSRSILSARTYYNSSQIQNILNVNEGKYSKGITHNNK